MSSGCTIIAVECTSDHAYIPSLVCENPGLILDASCEYARLIIDAYREDDAFAITCSLDNEIEVTTTWSQSLDIEVALVCDVVLVGGSFSNDFSLDFDL